MESKQRIEGDGYEGLEGSDALQVVRDDKKIQKRIENERTRERETGGRRMRSNSSWY